MGIGSRRKGERERAGRNRLNPKMHLMVQILGYCLKVKGAEGGDESSLLSIVLLTMWLKQEKNTTALLLLWKYYIWKFLVCISAKGRGK